MGRGSSLKIEPEEKEEVPTPEARPSHVSAYVRARYKPSGTAVEL